MLKHGGNLRQAAAQYGIALDEWLDLSTGINPDGWPVPTISPASWQHLPQQHDGLEAAAKHYYQAPHVLPVAGSQAAIQMLPLLRPCATVGMLSPAYAEHEYNWSQQGHTVLTLSPDNIQQHLPELDVLLLVHPNNPSGEVYRVEQLLDWHRQLSQRGGWLIVDEAFMDSTPEQSLAAYTDRPGLIVLRSLGKFFGLAGARCGFVLAASNLLDKLKDQLGPWTVSGPTREVACRALGDTQWHAATRQKLHEQGKRLKQLLNCYSLGPDGGTSLFQWLQHPHALAIHDMLAKQAIWTRYFEHPVSLRFGLPATQRQWQVLQQALHQVMNTLNQREEMNETLAL